MKTIHSITCRLITTPANKTRDTGILAGLLPEGVDLREDSLAPESEGGVFTNQLILLSGKMTKAKVCRQFLQRIANGLVSEDRRDLADTLEDRVDEAGVLYLRLDKAAATAGGLKLTDKGESIHVRVKIACYPVNKANAIAVARRLLP